MKKIVLRGIKNDGAETVSRQTANDARLEWKASYQVSATRAIGEVHELNLGENDLLEFIFDDDSTWFGGTDSLYHVFPEATGRKRAAGETFELPAYLDSGDNKRGFIGDIALKILNVFTKKAVTRKVKDIAIGLEKKLLEGRSGLYSINNSFQFTKAAPKKSDKPYLLFIHGTNSYTVGAFGDIYNSELWTHIVNTYSGNILGFEHETLTKSPLQNVAELMNELPAGAVLHVISHSRGGLVGDVLSRFCNDNNGFTDTEIAYLQKCNRADDINFIYALRQLASSKKLRLEQHIRVACPAYGTTILSKRLDHFLNISFNLLGLIGGPVMKLVAGEFRELISAAVEVKNDPTELPGLESMNPDSPFLKVLNNPDTRINAPLAVISGNTGIGLNLKALLVIASKLFYFRDNDLVVDTRSMYCGSHRTGTIQYFFDEGAEVDHVRYFRNRRTQDALLLALRNISVPAIPNFTTLQQDEEATLDRNALLGLDGGSVYRDEVSGTKPILILLPGIMGSNLKVKDKLVWINYLRFLMGELTRLDIRKDGIAATSLIKTSYKKIVDHFDGTYDVVTFPFDWRRPLADAADALNERILRYLPLNQPIRIVGHSMGGVVSRDFIIRHPQTWKQLNATPGFRLLLLGAPLGGSHRIPYVLAGKDPIISKLAKIDLNHTKKELLDVFRQFPGLLGLLPLSSQPADFASAATWKQMKEASLFDWNIPEASDLTFFKKYRDQVLSGLDSIDYSNIIYIAGKDDETVCGFEINKELPDEQLVFLSTAEGDQSVTWESGIPKQLIGSDGLYYVNVTHGALANEPSIFNGIAEILSTGKTGLLSKVRPVTRTAGTVFRATEKESFAIDPAGLERTLLGLPEPKVTTTEVNRVPLKVSISHGDLLYSRYPILVGHFRNDGIMSAESVIDYYMGGALMERQRLGMYPGDIGSNEVMLKAVSDFNGTVVMGLGDPGALTVYQLILTVEQGILKYMLESRTTGMKDNAENGISSLLIGAGYGGLSTESSLRAIIQGIQNANDKIQAMGLDQLNAITHIEFVELYEDRCLQCLYTLTRLAAEENTALNIRLSGQHIKKLFGSRLRLPLESSSEWWKRISVVLMEEQKLDTAQPVRSLRFSASTGSAREEQRDLFTTPVIIEQLINDLSTDNHWSDALARTVFELLIPNDFKENIRRQSNTIWILDKVTAGYPWELLQDAGNGSQPLCCNAGMIRQLYTPDFRIRIKPVANSKALIVGDPDLAGYAFASQLPGAEKEAHLVNRLLSDNGFDTGNTCIHSSSSAIIRALFQDDYKVIHLAGHGIFNEDLSQPSGMLIGNNVFLSTREICQMSTVPELVFVNCCFLGKMDGGAEKYYRDRFRLAANIGTQLIENGVKVVVAAGWAVDDDAAYHFTEVFYSRMLAGNNFGQAVLAARQSTFTRYPNTNTWGAYQCYGDPFFTLAKPGKPSAAKPYRYMIPQEAVIDLDNLLNKTDVKGYTAASLLSTLEAISLAVDEQGIRNAGITEKEAIAYAEFNQQEKAIEKFESLLRMEQAGFSVTALERYCNIRAKKCVSDWMAGISKSSQPAKLDKVIGDMEQLLGMSPTAERFCLMAKAYKSKALISSTRPQKLAALAQAASYFHKAVTKTDNNYKGYALSNWLAIEYVLVELGKHKWGADTPQRYHLPALKEIKEALKTFIDQAADVSGDMDFWGRIDQVNARLILWLLEGKGAEKAAEKQLREAFAGIWNSAGSQNKKISQKSHFEFLITMLSLAEGAVSKIKTIRQIKSDLENMIK